MERRVAAELTAWLGSTARRPLVLRGARQVGKTWLVRDLARQAGRELVELNLERDPTWRHVFEPRDPTRVLEELAVRRNARIDPDRVLLFLDEIQAAPELLATLRWLYEELPELPVVAAGSLLEFTLADHSLSMPVGRVTFRHVEPMGFDEFLRAHDRGILADALAEWTPGAAWSSTVQDEASRWFARYAMVGGMPAVVAADVSGASARDVRRLQADLVATYRADFAKYRGRLDRDVLDATLLAAARMVGQKFVYARVGEGVKQHQARNALERLAQARLVHIVPHSAANGLPLGGEVNLRYRKVLMGDVGLLHALVGTPAGPRSGAFPSVDTLSPSLRGQLADQLLGQQLRLTQPDVGDGPAVFTWQRGGGRPGEVDFVVGLAGRVIPVEGKAGAAGAMKSLHQFVHDKGLDLAVRCDANAPSVHDLDLRTTQGQPVAYRLLSVPPALVGQLDRLTAESLFEG